MNTLLLYVLRKALPTAIRHGLAAVAGFLITNHIPANPDDLMSVIGGLMLFGASWVWSYLTHNQLDDSGITVFQTGIASLLRNGQTALLAWMATHGISPADGSAPAILLALMNYGISLAQRPPVVTPSSVTDRLSFAPVIVLGFCLLSLPAYSRNATGWKPDPKGALHAYYQVQPEFANTVLKDEVDERPLLGPVWNQGNLGSCTAYGNTAAFVRAYIATNGVTPDLLSFLGLYYDEREHDGTVTEDAGSYISSGAWVLSHIGIGTDKAWPYQTEKFTIKPPASYYTEAKKFEIIKAVKIDSSTVAARHLGIMTALSNDRVVVFGGIVNNSIFKTGKDGFEPLPGGPVAGGHCRAIVGVSMKMTHRYSPKSKLYKGFYIVRNSWGQEWGDSGHSYIPVEVIEKLSRNDDFWTYITTTTPSKTKRSKSH
jgi:Papain family cysteine protease